MSVAVGSVVGAFPGVADALWTFVGIAVPVSRRAEDAIAVDGVDGARQAPAADSVRADASRSQAPA